MIVIVVTGKIASGKSYVTQLLKELGCMCLNLDDISREVLKEDSSCIEQILRVFGAEVWDESTESLDRKKLAQKVFNNTEHLRTLESIELPFIFRRFQAKLDDLKRMSNPPACVVVEVPVLPLFEDKLYAVDEVLFVRVSDDVRKHRARERGMDLDDFFKRDAHSPSDKYFLQNATKIIDNNNEEQDLRTLLKSWLDQIA